MAKIKKVSRQISYHKVSISVQDLHCIFSIKPTLQYEKVFKSTSCKKAEQMAKKYCKTYMSLYPGTNFCYDSESIEPYNYHEYIFVRED